MENRQSEYVSLLEKTQKLEIIDKLKLVQELAKSLQEDAEKQLSNPSINNSPQERGTTTLLAQPELPKSLLQKMYGKLQNLLRGFILDLKTFHSETEAFNQAAVKIDPVAVEISIALAAIAVTVAIVLPDYKKENSLPDFGVFQITGFLAIFSSGSALWLLIVYSFQQILRLNLISKTATTFLPKYIKIIADYFVKIIHIGIDAILYVASKLLAIPYLVLIICTLGLFILSFILIINAAP